MTKRHIEVYDTTLRDGVQASGVSFSRQGKLHLVERLDELGVDYIEGGYAGSNPRDLEFLKEASKLDLKHSQLVAFGSTRHAKKTVQEDEGLKALLEAGTPVVALFGKCWELHVTDVLKTTPEVNLAMISDSVAYLKEHGKTVFFDAEHFYDGYKDDPEFATAAVKAAEDAGADMVVLCDTNGGMMPWEVHEATSRMAEVLSVPLGVHAHNDSATAEANSLEAVRAGAVQIQGTLNGYGERCGNANICSLIPTLELKMDCECLPEGHLVQLRSVSMYVDELLNLRHDRKLPYVGKSAFTHKAGMHVNAVEKNPRTFEHVLPESVGNEREVLLSEFSGRSNVLLKAVELGVEGLQKSSPELDEVLAALKELEGRGYAFEAADASFRMLIQKVLKEHKPFFDLEGFRVIVEKQGHDQPAFSEATIKVRVNDQVEHTAGEGNGPVDALDQALRRALVKFYPEIAEVVLKDFRVRILDPEEATAAHTRVLIESSDGRETWGTVGVSENIIEASWEALVDSMEYKLFREEELRSNKEQS